MKRLKGKPTKHKKGLSDRQLLRLEVVVFMVVLLIFGAKTTNYLGIEALQPERLFAAPARFVERTVTRVRYHRIIGSCPAETNKIVIDWSYVCRKDTAPNAHVTIFDTYDRLGNRREYIYGNTNSGNIETAKLLVEQNKYDFQRYDLAYIPEPDWTEDPYRDRYWRFNYYGLQMVDDLVYAYRETGEERYAQKARELVNSFAADGIDARYAWDDYHAVAFRTMTLTNFWWKLRERGVLDIDTSNRVLALLERHGQFLSDRKHFEANQNHGVNEAAALHLLATAFPTLPNAPAWQQLATERLEGTLVDLIDADGVLIENSPFYHFYVLRKYWEIYQYDQRQNQPVNPLFKQKLDKMIRYATHILQPDTHPPTIGDSLDSQIFYNEEFEQMAHEYPEFKYVLTKGAHGERPATSNLFLETAGQAILRSDFGKNFDDQTQVVFQTSGYRSKHSHLDALSLTLSHGPQRLLVDPGLYSYEEDPISAYFETTAAHNTVTVDGKDQQKDKSQLANYAEDETSASATGSHELFEGVTHSRSVALLDKRTVIVIDKLSSESEHTYTQRFNLAPGAAVQQEDGSVIRARFPGREDPLVIRQLQGVDSLDIVNDQQRGVIGGICSNEYKKLLACPQVSATKRGTDVTFVTAIELDAQERQYAFTGGQHDLQVRLDDRREYAFQAQPVPAVQRRVETLAPAAQDASGAALTPGKPGAVIIMNNAADSVQYVLPILEAWGHKATLALPGKYLDQNYSDTLTASELRSIQKQYGWDSINHSYEDQATIVEYIRQQEFARYENDVIKGALTLDRHGLESNNNWFLYPEDSLTTKTREIAAKYYRFGAVAAGSAKPDALADSLAIKAFTVEDRTTLAEVQAAIDAAAAKNQTIFLVFERFKKSRSAQEPGYNIDDFAAITQHLASRRLKSMTLSELDASLGVEEAELEHQAARPAYTELTLQSQALPRNLWERIWDFLFSR